jgi:CO/xanthine dehydrogenase Mo-binding subunit
VRPDGRIEVTCPGQWMHEEREQIAHALGSARRADRRAHGVVGGAFGGREDISVQIVLALAAWKTGRPVKTVWSREESIVGHHKRHPYTITAKWGATRAGKIVAAQMDLTSDCGAYAYTSTKVLGNAADVALGPYQIPNVHVTARTVYTNNTPSGAFRGFGGPQGHFAAEMQVNKLAEALGIDPVELRMRNLWQEGTMLPTKSPLPAGCTIEPEVLAAAAERAGWRQETAQGWQRAALTIAQAPASPVRLSSHRSLTSLTATQRRTARGVGIACCFKNVGFSLGAPESCAAWVELHGQGEIAHAVVGCVGAEVGQGAHTVFRQLRPKCWALTRRGRGARRFDRSRRLERQRVGQPHELHGGQRHQGRGRARAGEWQNEERPARADLSFAPRPTTRYDRETGACDPNITYGYCAQVAEVEVDLDTGHVHVLRLISANDVGRAVNPQQVEGQIEGAVAQSMGWTLLEKYMQRDGRAVTQHFSTYLIPGVLDVPTVVEPIILEFPDPQGPLGECAAWRRCPSSQPRQPSPPRFTPPPAAGSTNCPTRRSGYGRRSTHDERSDAIYSTQRRGDARNRETAENRQFLCQKQTRQTLREMR